MKSFFRNNGLSVVVFGIFLIFWGGQAVVGRMECNNDRQKLGEQPLGMRQYLQCPHFLEATMENWESEFLQMGAYVFFTAFLYQKGSSESKDPDETAPQDEDPRKRSGKKDAPWPVRKGGRILKVYENSLCLGFMILFLASALLHAKGGAEVYNEEQFKGGKAPVTLWGYMGTSRYWFESLQNWQSEFLAIGSMVVLSIFLRQRGSPESKPVAASNWETGDED